MTAPILTTDRLILRAPEPRDRDAFISFCLDERAKWFGGPLTSSEADDAFDTWMGMAEGAAQGGCYLSIELRDSGETVGRAGIRDGDERPESEIAYALYAAEHEGQGFAIEAAASLRDWAYGDLGLPTVVSYIEPNNLNSASVARRMGASIDKMAPVWSKHPDMHVFRHPKPQEAAA